jgi:hypothetical protein
MIKFTPLLVVFFLLVAWFITGTCPLIQAVSGYGQKNVKIGISRFNDRAPSRRWTNGSRNNFCTQRISNS